jgi:hypothetical protein
MTRTELLQEIRKMRLEGAYADWNRGRMTQDEAARVLGMSEGNFRHYVCRYEAEGEAGLEDKRSQGWPGAGSAVRRGDGDAEALRAAICGLERSALP